MNPGPGNSRLDVVVIGAAGVDTNIFLSGGDIDFSVEANFTRNIDYVGGAGGYSSRGFARLGKRTAFLGYVGDDHNAPFIADQLAYSGIETTFFIDPAGSRRSVNIMYKDGRRKNFYDGRGSMTVRPDIDACTPVLSRARLAHFSIENWTRYLLAPARELGVTVACDLQDVVSVDDPYRADFVAGADILFFSAANFSDPSDLIYRFFAAGRARIIIAGMGSRGCALGVRDAGVQCFDPVSIDLPVVDTNGAGDGLAVGFLTSYLLDNFSLEDSILRGQIVARYTCSRKADSTYLITRAQLDAYFTAIKSNTTS
jgi:sugar/nucleoside kinase (ribokinase family)